MDFDPVWVLASSLVAALTARSVEADDLAASKDSTKRLITFEADVSAIFRTRCWRCHGEKTLKGELDLRSIAEVLKGGESGPVIVPGKPDESLLFEKVHNGEMPPAKKDRLAEADVKTIRLWIENGAKASITPKPLATSGVTQNDVIPVMLRPACVYHG